MPLVERSHMFKPNQVDVQILAAWPNHCLSNSDFICAVTMFWSKVFNFVLEIRHNQAPTGTKNTASLSFVSVLCCFAHQFHLLFSSNGILAFS